jgi:hypothetical protein
MYPSGNEQSPELSAEYWRARAEEIEKQLTETRMLLLHVVRLLPPEHLSKLSLNLMHLPRAIHDNNQPAVWPERRAE